MNIYIIDDNETNLDLFKTVARKADPGVDLHCYSDPLIALQACAERLPDAVVVDYMMPELDGHEFIRRFRTYPGAADVPVIMITAETERHVRRTALDLGVSDFLTKPIDPYEMRARLRTVISLRRSYLELQDRGRWLGEEVERATQTILERERGVKLGLMIADAANHTGSVSDIFHLALAEIAKFAGWAAGTASFIDGDALGAGPIWHAGHEAQADTFRQMIDDASVPNSLVRQAIATGRPCWVEDAAVDACGFNARCVIPVVVADQTTALLQFFTNGGLHIDDSRLALLMGVSSQLSRVVERARAEQQLIYNASHDPLTHLPNRMSFTERLDQAIAARKRDPEAGFAVLFIDLDRFKIVNDSLGHLVGDDLLIQVAARMRACLRASDTLSHVDVPEPGERHILARLGGDEFIVLLDRIEQPSDALRVGNRIQDELRQPFQVAGTLIHIGASIGITLSAIAYDNSAAVLRDADLAMYRAKSLGKSRCEMFDPIMHEAAMVRLTLEADLRRALRNDEFVLQYQPIVDLATRQVAGFEALVRWQRPDGQVIRPDEFIHVAEETGLIVFLGAWVLRESCRQLSAWDAGFPGCKPLTMSVNASPREFKEPGFVDQVKRILRETGADPGRIRLEITEKATMGDAERAVAVLSQLRALGVQLSVDDFGIGYSNLSYLHRFPLNVLKIDRSFVVDLIRKPESREVINSIVGLARSMGLSVVAEGAEQADQIEMLTLLGCDFVQGFAFHRPLDPGAVWDLLRSRTTSPMQVA